MPTIHVINRAGEPSDFEAETGVSVMENLRDNDYEVEAICGGSCSCATCHVYVDPAWLEKLPAQEADERELVSDEPTYQPNSRLSCQIEMTEDLDGLTLTIAPEA
ncbi:2Fe-2S iron-sulfur cluster-binding protein [Minwuia thermotolerans]|uniref:Ferredoxin n=1 Tax=Minwuia thermotolerans TaxID=2056226 RepID=A0A2M9G1U4_9PROT|nr:2Fe-2S iron-sulfur cluster-binding protein [Minwuia thermotolerans]PJK29679.1 ferredoxin [Minwuia thermotolerans]